MIKACLIAIFCLACKNTSPPIKEPIVIDNNVDINLPKKDSFHVENTTKEYNESAPKMGHVEKITKVQYR